MKKSDVKGEAKDQRHKQENNYLINPPDHTSQVLSHNKHRGRWI